MNSRADRSSNSYSGREPFRGGEVTKIFYLMIGLLILAGCATRVSFQNAKLTEYDPPTEKIRGILAKPEGDGPFPAVVLLHTCGGVQRHVSRDWPAFLTENGYAALTVDTFGSRNAGRCPAARHLGGATMRRDAYGALDYLASRPDIVPDQIGVMGFSLGGRAIEAIAEQSIKSPEGRNFKAGIAFYGGCSVIRDPSFPVLEIIGRNDTNSYYCSGGSFKNWSVKILPGAYHAFDQPQITSMRTVSGGHSAIYDRTATDKARELTRRFLDKNLAR